MKTLRIFIALCIILSFSANLANAQEKKNWTDSYSMDVEVALELWCDETYIDFIKGVSVEAHVREHYINGNKIWMKVTVHGTILFNGVTYKIDGKTTIIEENIQEAHYNLKGDDGSHYVGIVTVIEGNPTTFTFSKALCPGN